MYPTLITCLSSLSSWGVGAIRYASVDYVRENNAALVTPAGCTIFTFLLERCVYDGPKAVLKIEELAIFSCWSLLYVAGDRSLY